MLQKFALILILFSLLQIYFNWTRIAEFQAENEPLKQQLDALKMSGNEREKEKKNQNDPVPIIFITPTAYRPAQKADLTRLGQTLANIQNLFWVIVEDAQFPSKFIDDLLARLRIEGAHIFAETPAHQKANITDPRWKFHRGVVQRNEALRWIRKKIPLLHGIVYFGDDDNTYDWRLFDEMRKIKGKIGIWPVGIVGGMLVETPLLFKNSTVRGFNSLWRPRRPFPIDMAGFALNLSLIHVNAAALFSVNSPRGYLESHFLQSLGVQRADLEPLAELCTKILVWHTRTERTQLIHGEMQKFLHSRSIEAPTLLPVERDAIF